jgi:peptidoglycan L-alanyl-D-glutamate endopeptidase CwlK
MNVFGERSIAKLENLHPDLVRLLYYVLRRIEDYGMDITIVWTHRGEDEQNEAHRNGKSMLVWPDSKHNKMPAEAADLAPLIDGRIPWNEKLPWMILGAVIMEGIIKLKIPARWGGLFMRTRPDGKREPFFDGGHVEIHEEE